MRSISLILKQFSRSVILMAGLAICGLTAYAQGDASKGEAIFKAKCTACHKLDQRMIGPALGPQLESETDDKWLTKWIQNNQALIAAKDPKALKIYNEYNQAAMTVFGDLSDGDVSNIISYVRTEYKKEKEAAPAAGAAVAAESGPSNLVVFGLIGVIVIAFIVILVLNKVISTLERLVANRPALAPEEVVAAEEGPSTGILLAKALVKNKKFVFFVVLCVTIFFSSWTWVSLWNTNVHTGYQPVQPIKFPHDLHAGAMQINCQYCHSGAYKSKNATIPSLNICMNCHKVITTRMGAKQPSDEIAKIYDALGYDPATQKYDSTKMHPIQWVRVHNLPDLAYFNHSQHVKVQGLKCQTCHGPVETMKEVYQYSPVTMKWCIQCHKRTNVDFKDNAYYTNLEQVHALLKEGKPVTASVMGGIECGKCHY